MYKVCPDNFWKITIKQTVGVATFCVFSFCQYGSQRSSCISGSALITAGAPRRSWPPCYFSYPHPSSSRRPSEREWGRPARSLPPLPLKEWECCLRLLKNRSRHRFGCLTRPELLLLHLQGKPFFHPPGQLLWEFCHSHESGVNHSSWHIIGLREFPDILLPVILQVGDHIGDESLCIEISLIRHRPLAVSCNSPLEKMLLFCILVKAWSL